MAKNTKVETTKELGKRLQLLKEAQKRLDADVVERQASINQKKIELADAQTASRNAEREIVETTNRMFAREVLTLELLDARRRYLAQVRCERSEKITVRKQRELHSGNTTLLASLQAACSHPFVFSYDGYGGSRSMDYDDACCGRRVCTLCNLAETSEETSGDVYKVLVDNSTRLVRRDLRNEKDRPMSFQQEWFSTNFLQQLFEASAGDINIHWPKNSGQSALKF